MVVVADRPMARNDLSVKIDAEVLKQARIVATHRNIPVAEYLSELVRPLVGRDYRKSVDEMSREASGGQDAAPKKGR